jgi:hypothetical protein
MNIDGFKAVLAPWNIKFIDGWERGPYKCTYKDDVLFEEGTSRRVMSFVPIKRIKMCLEIRGCPVFFYRDYSYCYMSGRILYQVIGYKNLIDDRIWT